MQCPANRGVAHPFNGHDSKVQGGRIAFTDQIEHHNPSAKAPHQCPYVLPGGNPRRSLVVVLWPLFTFSSSPECDVEIVGNDHGDTRAKVPHRKVEIMSRMRA
jgi:hypothetical protein